MAIKFNEKTGTFDVSYYKRHPVTRLPVRAARIGVKTKAEANRVYAKLVIQVEKKIHEQVTPNWQSVTESFLETCRNRGLTEHTIHDYSSCLEAYTFKEWGDRPIDLITTQEVRELIRIKAGEKSPSHQKNLLKFIRSVFQHGVELGALVRNPSPEMKFRIGDKIKKVLTEEQVRIFLTKAKEMNVEWYPIWATAVYSGMRNGELFALTWDKVNLDDRFILVNESWNNKDGFKSTKSGDDRINEIAPNLLLVLKQLKLQSSGSPYVFPRVRGWDKGEQARELRMFLQGIGLPPIRFHDLRATWATLLLSKGVEPIKVMKAGGWKDMKTMMIYVRKAGVDIRGMSDCLDLHNPVQESGTVIRLGADKWG